MKTNRRKFIYNAALGLMVPATGIIAQTTLRVSGTARVGSVSRPGSGGGGGGSFLPTDISGLKLWVRASDGTGTNVSCYTDAGSTLATNGQTIRQWNDESGNSSHLTQATSGSRGTWNSGVVNSKAAITMVAASSQYWDIPNVFSSMTAGEGFCVLIFDADPPAAQKALIGTTGNAAFQGILDTDGILYDSWGSDTRRTTVNPTPSLTSWRLYNVSTASGNWTSRLDGTEIFTTGTNNCSFWTAPQLGRSGSVYFDGKFAEYIVYDSVLSSGNRTSVNDYIETKYGLTIA